MTDETKNDGGPAFPAEGGSDSGLHANPGMTLRDWFAGQCITVATEAAKTVKDYELTKFFGPSRTGIKKTEIISALAYELADAMIAERKR